MPPPSLTQILRRERLAQQHAAAGYFNPGGMYFELLTDPEAAEDVLDRVTLLATLLHERMHWLQLIGTSAGLHSAYVSTLQNAVLPSTSSAGRSLTLQDLPLLDSGLVNDSTRQVWLACELQHLASFGTSRAYFEALCAQRAQPHREVLSAELRKLAEQVLADRSSGYVALQDRIWAAAEFTEAGGAFLQHRDVGIGAAHLMETSARINELFKLSSSRVENYGVSTLLAFGRPYGLARELFYTATNADPGPESEMALCVLCDWALCTPLPPLLPASGAAATSVATPGMIFGQLLHAYRSDVIPTATEGKPVEFAEALAINMYESISARVKIPTPIDVAKFTVANLASLADVEIPAALYHGVGDGAPKPVDALSRLRYLTILTLRAAETRLAHPAFFALPISYYDEGRPFFHSLFDPIEPPIWSIPGRRFAPTRDDADWFSFFYSGALVEEIRTLTAFCDAEALGRQLRGYRGTLVASADEAHLIEQAIVAVLGDGLASEVALAASWPDGAPR